MLTCVASVLAVALAAAADSPANDAAAKDKARLTGAWDVVAVEANGRKLPPQATAGFQFLFTADKLTRKRAGKVQSEAGYRVDPAARPAHMDFYDLAGKETKIVPALYALDGDTLRLCFRNDYKQKGKVLDETQRPKKLDGSAGSGQVLMTLKRVKP